MRSSSLRTICSLLLLSLVLLYGPVASPSFAQPGITIGFAVDEEGLVVSSELAKDVGLYLESQLPQPVKVRNFTSEDFLYNWLARYREVDFAWLNRNFINNQPVGEIYVLAENLDHTTGQLQGGLVARQGLETTLVQQVRDVFLHMQDSPQGQMLLAKLEVSRFISSSRWQTPGWVEATPATRVKPKSKQDAVATVSEDPQVEVVAPAMADPSLNQPLSASAEPPSPEIAGVSSQTSTGSPETSAVDQKIEPVSETPPTVEDGKVAMVEDKVPTSSPDQEEPIALVADYLAYNSVEDSYEAKGDVILRQAKVELKSESLLWQAATQDAEAKGAVQLDDSETSMSGSSMQYNMATGQGQVSDGRVFVREGNFHLAGQLIEKEGQADYFVKEGSFTTCDGEIPDWKFSADEVDVTLGGYARAKHVWFHVKDVPVLYTPYLMFPVKTERESGLLMPRFGYSNNKGTLAHMAWYQVIDRHMDATVYLDYLSEIGLGKGLEYRYALSGQNNGEALYYHVTGTGEIEEQDVKEDFPDLDYYRWEHQGNLPGGWRLMADIEYTDRKLFFEEFGEVAEDYNRDKTVSTLMLRKNWQKLNLVGYARYIKDLETDNADTIQHLPELSLGLPRYRLGDTPVYAGLESYATRFWRDEGDDGERLYLRPSLSAVFKPGSWLELTPEVAFYERLYSTDTTDTDDFIPEFSVALSTRLAKSFDVDLLGADRIQHSLEPTVTYTYVPDEEQDDLPLFDLQDRISSRNDVTYALVNRLVARSVAADGSNSYRDLFYLRLSQRYDIDEARNDRSGKDQPFSDLRVEMDFNPVAKFSLNAESLIPVYGDNGFNTLSVGSTVRDDMGNALKASYTYKDIDFARAATDYGSFQVVTPMLKPVYLTFRERYDFQENRALEDFVGFEYRSKCWSIMLSYKTRYREDEDNDHEIGFMFVLAGLGQNMGFANGFDNAVQ